MLIVLIVMQADGVELYRAGSAMSVDLYKVRVKIVHVAHPATQTKAAHLLNIQEGRL